MIFLLLIVLLGVLALYGRSVFRTTGHALREAWGFMTILLYTLFIGAMLMLLVVYS